MEFKIKSKFEIGDEVIVDKSSSKQYGKVIDVILHHTNDGYENFYKIKYLVELKDRSRLWYLENYLGRFKDKD